MIRLDALRWAWWRLLDRIPARCHYCGKREASRLCRVCEGCQDGN